MTSTPPLDERLPGYEVHTKDKEAIRQLYGFAKMPIWRLQDRYSLSYNGVCKIIDYDAPERARPNRQGAPHLLSDIRVHEIILFCSESYENRVLDYIHLHDELELECSLKTLERRLKQCGYYRCVACQKPYLTLTQANARWVWGMGHIFWKEEWKRVLWSDEVTFLVGGRTVKQKVTRNRSERYCLTCIQHQFHRGGTTPVHAWGGIGYGYKTPLVFIKGSGKTGAFTQKDYLAQVLEPHIVQFLDEFATHAHTHGVKPLFMEDGNSAHGHKSEKNCCFKYRAANGIILLPHPSTSPDMNPIEKCWRRIKQALHRRRRQPTTEEEMRAMVTEEWNRIPQEWINDLIMQQDHWVKVLVQRCGWSTPN